MKWQSPYFNRFGKEKRFLLSRGFKENCLSILVWLGDMESLQIFPTRKLLIFYGGGLLILIFNWIYIPEMVTSFLKKETALLGKMPYQKFPFILEPVFALPDTCPRHQKEPLFD